MKVEKARSLKKNHASSRQFIQWKVKKKRWLFWNFGGVLLGTGGLVRAYSKAVQEGLAASKVILKQKGIALKITTDYTGLGKIQYIAGERNIPVLDSEYTDKVVMKLLVPVQDVGSVQKAITEGTNGRAGIEKDQELYYAVIDGKVITFDH